MKICIDPGHGGTDPGATFGHSEEKDITLAISRALAAILSPHHRIIMTRTTDDFVGLRERTEIANDYGADLLVSIHTNADPDPDEPGMPEARGEEVWYFEGSANGAELARFLGEGLQLVFPDEPFRGTKPGRLWMTRKTVMPAVLVEIGFIDNSETNRRLDYRLERREVAYALALGLLRREQFLEQGTTFG